MSINIFYNHFNKRRRNIAKFLVGAEHWSWHPPVFFTDFDIKLYRYLNLLFNLDLCVYKY